MMAPVAGISASRAPDRGIAAKITHAGNGALLQLAGIKCGGVGGDKGQHEGDILRASALA